MTRRGFLVFTLAAAVTSAVASAQVQKSERPGIRNFSRVDATVGCGGAVDPSALAGLKKEGFVSVINLRMASEAGAEIEASRAAAQAAGLKYIHLPLDGGNPSAKVFDDFLAAVADKSNQPIFVHCASASRVGAVWMVKRVLQDGWALDRAKTEAEAIGLASPKLATFATEYINSHKR
jgi:uncharacterized protein (TIGR01244 family)